MAVKTELLHVLWADIPRSVTGNDYDMASFNSASSHVQSLLLKWAEIPYSTKLAIPLAYNYGQYQVTFSELKYHDRVVADLIRTCDFLDIHLCMIHEIRYTKVPSYTVTGWISLYDQPVNFEKWSLNKDYEVLKHDGDDVCYKHGPVPALMVWPKARKFRALCASVSLESSLNWFQDHHGDQLTCSDAGKNDLLDLFNILIYLFFPRPKDGLQISNFKKVVELFLKAKLIDHAFHLMYWLHASDTFDNTLAHMVELLLASGDQDRTLRIIKVWGWNLIRKNCMVEAIHSCGWDKCKEVIESLLVNVPQDIQVENMVYVVEGLESCGYHEVAMVIGKNLFDKISNKQYDLNWRWTDNIIKLVLLFVKHGLNEEAYYLIENVPMDFKLLIGVGEEIFDVLYASLDKWQSKRRVLHSCFRDGFLQMVSGFIFKLASIGYNTIAEKFVRKWVSLLPDNVDEEIRTLKCPDETAALLLYATPSKQRMQILVKMKRLYMLKTFMKLDADFIGLKQKKEVTQAFTDLCLHKIDGKEFPRENEVYRKNSHLQEEWSETIDLSADVQHFLEILFWLDDKFLLDAMVKRLVQLMNLTRKVFAKENGLVIVAMKSGVYARKALKKLADARISYLEEKVSSQKRQQVGNPRMERVFCDMLMEQRRELEGLKLLLQEMLERVEQTDFFQFGNVRKVLAAYDLIQQVKNMLDDRNCLLELHDQFIFPEWSSCRSLWTDLVTGICRRLRKRRSASSWTARTSMENKAKKLFDEMPQKNVAMIRGHAYKFYKLSYIMLLVLLSIH